MMAETFVEQTRDGSGHIVDFPLFNVEDKQTYDKTFFMSPGKEVTSEIPSVKKPAALKLTSKSFVSKSRASTSPCSSSLS